jgi:hypothetical protein
MGVWLWKSSFNLLACKRLRNVSFISYLMFKNPCIEFCQFGRSCQFVFSVKKMFCCALSSGCKCIIFEPVGFWCFNLCFTFSCNVWIVLVYTFKVSGTNSCKYVIIFLLYYVVYYVEYNLCGSVSSLGLNFSVMSITLITFFFWSDLCRNANLYIYYCE